MSFTSSKHQDWDSSTMVTYKSGWIFSKTKDLCLFGLPLLTGLGIVLLYQFTGLRNLHIGGKEAPVIVFALLAFLDGGHVFSTISISYTDGTLRRDKVALLFAVPVLLYLIMIALYETFGLRAVLLGVGYFNIYHVVRQQYGWVSITSKKAGETDNRRIRLDKLTIYALMVLPVIWAHFSFAGGDKRLTFPFNATVAKVCLVAWCAVLGSYAIRQTYRAMRGLPLNMAKILQMAVSSVTWGTIMFTRPATLGALLVMPPLVHAVPYLGIVYSRRSRMSEDRESFPLGPLRKVALWQFLVVLAVVGTVYTKANNYVKGFKTHHLLGVPAEFFVCAFLIFPIMHFAIDGVIWKQRPTRKASIGDQPLPAVGST